MPAKKGIFGREGFKADHIQSLLLSTILNPAVTLPLLLLARHTAKGRRFALDHPLAVQRLKLCLYIGVARWLNGLLSRGALNNWTRAKYDWKKELVVITGGSDGIGKLMVHLFAARGIQVVILDRQPPKFDMPNSTTYYMELDLVDPEAIGRVSNELKSKYGDPTILLLNAGIANRYTILHTPEEAYERLLAVNQAAHHRLARVFVPAMVRSNHGMIVTVASLAGYLTPAGMVDYCTTKAAAVAFHEGLSDELRHRYAAPAVRTVLVCPHFVRTALSSGFVNDSGFVMPTLEPETVAEAVFEAVMSGESGVVALPEVSKWLAMTARAWPWWTQRWMMGKLKGVMAKVEVVPEGLEGVVGGEKYGKQG